MLDLIASGVAQEWLGHAQLLPATADPIPLLSTWQGAPLLNPPQPLEPAVAKILTDYLQNLRAMGLDPQYQGIWLQTDSVVLGQNQAYQPFPAASLTKAATTLTALNTWPAHHRFQTLIGYQGQLNLGNGQLRGDLVIQGGGDPLFVWEDAQALALKLNQIGLRQVTGQLIVTGPFAMNYQTAPQQAGLLLKQGLSGASLAQSLTPEQLKDINVVKIQTQKLAAQGLLQVTIAGGVTTTTPIQTPIQPLIAHQSLPLQDLLREMNIYSNNEIAQMLADATSKSTPGHHQVMAIAAAQAGVPASEIQLINGSGLGMDNRISPRAATYILRAIQRQALGLGLTLADFFPASGLDRQGSMLDRTMPLGTTLKTGTLNQVSALSGVLPTRQRGLVWFTIINRGSQIGALRQQQDRLLRDLQTAWGGPTVPPLAITRRLTQPPYLGDPQRHEIRVKSTP